MTTRRPMDIARFIAELDEDRTIPANLRRAYIAAHHQLLKQWKARKDSSYAAAKKRRNEASQRITKGDYLARAQALLEDVQKLRITREAAEARLTDLLEEHQSLTAVLGEVARMDDELTALDEMSATEAATDIFDRFPTVQLVTRSLQDLAEERLAQRTTPVPLGNPDAPSLEDLQAAGRGRKPE